MNNSEIQKKKVERLAAEQGITPTEYKRRCDKNTALHKGLSISEYGKKRIEDAAEKKNMSVYEYKKECAEKTARNKGFRNRKEYDLAGKRAKVLHITKEQYCSTLEKDSSGFYVLPELKYRRHKT